MKGEHLKFGIPRTHNAFQAAPSSETSPKTETEPEKGKGRTPASLEDTLKILQTLGKLRELRVNPADSRSARELQLVPVKYLCKGSRCCE